MMTMLIIGVLVAVAIITYVVLSRKLLPHAGIPDNPLAFGYKTIWFAVKSNDAAAVAAVFGDPNPQPCNWKTGIDRAYTLTLKQFGFVTPPIDGWTLVVGWKLPSADAKGSEEAVLRLIDRLSKQFGEAQWFASQRVVEYHGWARSTHGRTTRHYSYVGDKGETLYSEGEPTAAEPAHLVDTRGTERADAVVPTEETVMQIAAAWSIDPTTLEQRQLAPSLGLLVRAQGIQ